MSKEKLVEYKRGDRVVYTQTGERGVVSSANATYVFVQFTDFLSDERTSQAVHRHHIKKA